MSRRPTPPTMRGCRTPCVPRGGRIWGLICLATILFCALPAGSLGEELTPTPLTAGGADPREILPEALAIQAVDTGCLPLDTPKSGVRVFADALFWTAREGGADNWAQIITPKEPLGTYVGSATLIDAPFDWNTGFRVGVGRQSNGGDSDVVVYYTNFRTQATSQATGEVYSAFLGNFFAGNTDGDAFGPHYRSASMRWDFAFHTVDLEARRAFTIAPNLTVRPFVGLKAAVIDQSVNSHWRHPIDTSEKTYQFNLATDRTGRLGPGYEPASSGPVRLLQDN